MEFKQRKTGQSHVYASGIKLNLTKPRMNIIINYLYLLKGHLNGSGIKL